MWRSFARFDGRAAFATWMYRVALNVAISFQRREIRRSQPLVASDERLLNVAAAQRDEPEDVRCLYDFIDALETLDRALILLYLEEYRYREIAEITGLTETNVATKLGRLKLRLQQHFSTARAASRKRHVNTMERDDFQTMWAADKARLERELAVNSELLHKMSLGPALASSRRLSWIELAFDAIAIVLLGSFAADYFAEPRFSIPAIILGIGAIVLVALRIRQVLDTRPPAFDEPLVAVLERFETMRALNMATLRWIAALGALAWVPLQIVLFKAVFNFDVYAFGAPYLIANAGFGIAVAVGAILRPALLSFTALQVILAYPRLLRDIRLLRRQGHPGAVLLDVNVRVPLARQRLSRLHERV